MGLFVVNGLVSGVVNAQTCTPLEIVKGEGTEVTKSVSPPNVGTIPNLPVGYRGNWDTDFIVPSGNAFSSYQATIRSESSEPATYRVKVYLKYPDDTTDRVFDNEVELEPGETQTLKGSPRIDQQPYQVNLNIGGYDSIGYSYTISVEACP